MATPFPSTSRPGHGTIHLSLLPPCTPALRTLSYQYPLKLIAPSPLPLPLPLPEFSSLAPLIHTVFLLTYGGGLVAGDTLHIEVVLARSTRLVLLTQGSTKVFKAPGREVVSTQRMRVRLEGGAALCYLPDPVQPFRDSVFEARQIYELVGGAGEGGASLCVCDWVSEGRTARGEKWDFWRYGSRSEVWGVDEQGKRRLLVRDNIILDEEEKTRDRITGRLDGLGVFGTLILGGPVFEGLGRYLMDEFERLPRIGARNWDAVDEEVEVKEDEVRRRARLKREARDGVIWTAARVRGFVLVKFGAREVEGARIWLSHMLRTEGSVEGSFGERALLCLR